MTPPSHLPHPVIDCHVHVFDLPSAAEIGTADQLGHVFDAHGVGQGLLVEPNSGYGLDNRCMLAAIARGAGRYKGIAMVRNDASRQELQDLQGQGIIGAAFNVALLGVDVHRHIGPLLERLRDLGMWAQMQVQHDELCPLKEMLVDSGVRLLFDHCGRPDPARGIDQPGFAALLSLAAIGRTVVKLSSPLKLSTHPYPYPDARRFVDALVETYTPQSLVWASDWPSIRAPARIDYGPLLDLTTRWLPDPAACQDVLWDTPRRLFGFD